MSEAATTLAAGGATSGVGGDPSQQPKNDGEKKNGKGGRPPKGSKCGACGNWEHLGKCWRPCNLCGIRHNLRKPCHKGAVSQSSPGFFNPSAFSPLPSGGSYGSGGVTGSYGAAVAHLGGFVMESLAAFNARPSVTNNKGGVQSVVGGAHVLKGRVKKNSAAKQSSKQLSVAPDGTPEKPADGSRKPRKPRWPKGKKRSGTDKSDQGQKGKPTDQPTIGTEESMDLDPVKDEVPKGSDAKKDDGPEPVEKP